MESPMDPPQRLSMDEATTHFTRGSMDSPGSMDGPNLYSQGSEGMDDVSVSSIPPPPPPMDLPPVASEESVDITEAERLRVQQEISLQEQHELQLQQQEFDHHQQQQQYEKEVPEMAQPPTDMNHVANKDGDGHTDGCCDGCLKCCGLIPVPSLLSWILMLLGIGAFTGSVLFATWQTRDAMDDDTLMWFMEYTIIGVVVGMVVVGTLILMTSHYSSEPTSRRAFNSFSKNKCAQGLNVFALVVSYILTLGWILLLALLATPLVFLINYYIVDPDTLDMGFYGFNNVNNSTQPLSGKELVQFEGKIRNLLIVWGIAFFSALLVINSLVCFIICISSNIAHLRDSRFATLNAYQENDVRHSKHSVVDTNF